MHDDPEVVAGFGAGAGRGGEAGMVPCGAVGRWPVRSTAPSGLSPAYANGLASALFGTGDTVAVSREVKSPVPGEYHRAPIDTFPVTASVQPDW